MTDYRTALHRLYRQWKSGAISKATFDKRRAALKARTTAAMKREGERKKRSQSGKRKRKA